MAVGKIDPWSSSGTFGSPRSASPAFQREYKSVDCSGVLVDDTASQTIVLAPSSSTEYGTTNIWGITFATADADFAGGHLKDEDGNVITTVVGTQNGPISVGFRAPVKVTENSAVVYHQLAYQASTYITVFYTVSRKNIGDA